MPALIPTGPNYHTNIWVNGKQLAGYVDWSTLRIVQSGNQEIGSCDFTVTDIEMTAAALTDEAFVHVADAAGSLFKGFVKVRAPRVAAIGRIIEVSAKGIELLLDSTVVISNVRPAGESDKARLQYFLAAYGSQGLYNSGIGSTDTQHIKTLRASMPKQRFRSQTLRQVFEQVLAVASESADYYIDSLGRLHTFDAANPEADTAPYAVRVGDPANDTEMAPEELLIDFDTESLVNDYWVRAKVRSADLREADLASINTYGRRAAIIDAPDADTAAKAEAVGKAALKDNAAPKVRGSFGVTTPFDSIFR